MNVFDRKIKYGRPLIIHHKSFIDKLPVALGGPDTKMSTNMERYPVADRDDYTRVVY